MVRPSPQTERLVEILEFLAADTAQQRSLADIARMLQVDKATCLPMLAELTRRGWLVRHPQRKTYQLGPRLVSIGDAARGATNAVDIARPALAGLADELGVVCAALITSGTDLVVAELVQPRGLRRSTLGQQIGDRVQLRPPLASIFLAWADEKDVADWLSRGLHTGKPDTEAHYRAVLAAVRRRGYGVEYHDPDLPSMTRNVETELRNVRGKAREPLLEAQYERLMRPEMAAAELDPQRRYRAFSINAAVFDDAAQPVLAICAYDFTDPLTAAEVHSIGLTVRATARQVTRAIHGIEPAAVED